LRLQSLLFRADASPDLFFESGPTFLQTFLQTLQDRLGFKPNSIQVRGDRIPSLHAATRNLGKELDDAARVNGFAGDKDVLRQIEKYFDERTEAENARVFREKAGSPQPLDIPNSLPVGLLPGHHHHDPNSEQSDDSDDYDADDVPGFVHPNTRIALAKMQNAPKSAALNPKEKLKPAPVLGRQKQFFSDDELAFKELLAKVGKTNSNLTTKYILPCFSHLDFSGEKKLEFLRIPASFERLKRVALNECSLQAFAPDFLLAPNLEELSLYNNSIRTVRPYDRRKHARNKKLKFLGLGCNFLDGAAVEELLEWFCEILVLDVSFNFVTELDAWSDTLMKIDLTGNPLSFAPDLEYLLADMFPRNASTEILRELDSGKFGGKLLGTTKSLEGGKTVKPWGKGQVEGEAMGLVANKPVPLSMTFVSVANLHLASTDPEVLAPLVSQLCLKIDTPTGAPFFLRLSSTTGEVPDLASLSAQAADPENENAASVSSAIAFDTAATCYSGGHEQVEVGGFSPAALCSWVISVPYVEIGYLAPPGEGEEEAAGAPEGEELSEAQQKAREQEQMAAAFVGLAGGSVEVQRWLWEPRKVLNNVQIPLVLGPANAKLPKNRMPHLNKVAGAAARKMVLHAKLALKYAAASDTPTDAS